MIVVIIFINTASSSLEPTTSQNIVDIATRIVRDLGYPGADEPCVKQDFSREVSVGTWSRCLLVNQHGRIEEIPFLECDELEFAGRSGVVGSGLCKVKSWIVFLTLGLIVVGLLGLLGCLCSCFCAC